MTKLKFMSAALIAATMLATPTMARESRVTSRHAAESDNASTTSDARYPRGSGVFRNNHFGGDFGGTTGDGYVHRDVWGHWGTYYGPMVPTL